jgi:hypothetical protein
VTTRAIAVDVELELGPGADARAPGAVVTVALCGHWEHEGACRWPHNSRIDHSGNPARLRTVAVVDEESLAEVERRIDAGLRGDPRWTVLSFQVGEIGAGERSLAERLARTSTD